MAPMSLHFLFLTTLILSVLGNVHGVGSRPLFIFGGSFVDTGNVKSWDSSRPPWKIPYGQSWPGQPSGRYGNGHVLTDLVATSMSLPTPVAYGLRDPSKIYSEGVNFAVGGTGIMPDTGGSPYVNAQIDQLQGIIGVYTKDQLASALVLYVTDGEDYLYYLNVQKGSLADIYPLTVNVGKQISNDLVRLYGMGLRNFLVTALPPLGCFPFATAPNFYQSCNDSINANVANAHNARVWKNVLGLKHWFKNGTLNTVDVYTAFRSAMGSQSLRPCCVGATAQNKCSDVDSGKKPLYGVCNNPSSTFFWDDSGNPTEGGWQSIVNIIKPSLNKMFT